LGYVIRPLEHFHWLEKPAEINLAGSGIHPISLEELAPVRREPSEILGAEDQEILVTHGAQEASFLVQAAVLSSGDKVVLPRPEYSPLVFQSELLGAKVVQVPHNELFDHLNGAKMVILSNPNNPLGTYLKLQELSEECRKYGCYVLVDETFRYFVDRDLRMPAMENTLRVSTLAKICNFHDRRAGWLVGPKELMVKVKEAQNLISPPPLDQERDLLRLVFGNIGRVVERALEITKSNYQLLSSSGLDFSYAKFLPYAFVKAPAEFTEAIHRKGVLVLPGKVFWLDYGFRISLGNRDQGVLKEGLRRILSILKP
jgi:aspartate/methionine/tyrosine aminotransferase